MPRELFGAAEEANPKIVGCTQCTQRFKRVYDSRKVQEVFHVEHGGAIEFDVKSRPLLIKGDVKVQFCDENTVRKKDKMCHFWVHSHFLLNQSQGRLHLRRANTDKACKGKYASRFPPEFEIILEAGSMPTQTSRRRCRATPSLASVNATAASSRATGWTTCRRT